MQEIGKFNLKINAIPNALENAWPLQLILINLVFIDNMHQL